MGVVSGSRNHSKMTIESLGGWAASQGRAATPSTNPATATTGTVQGRKTRVSNGDYIIVQCCYISGRIIKPNLLLIPPQLPPGL